MPDPLVIQPQPAPRTASRSRGTAAIALIVLHSNTAPAAAALVGWTAPDSRVAPHYYVDAAGAVTQLVSEERAARHSGNARWHGRRRSIDRISVGIVLEHTPGAPYPAAQHSALDQLIRQIQAHSDLDNAAVFRWEADRQTGAPGDGALLPPDLPLLPLLTAPPAPDTLTLGTDALVLDEDVQCVPPPLPPLMPPAAVLGSEDAAPADAQLWPLLAQETYRQRGEGFRGDWSFHQHAVRDSLGAPLAPSASASDQIVVGGKRYGYQVFARDTLFNEIPRWDAVQSMNDALGGSIPAAGLARALLEASYRATGNALHADWSFHQLAVRERLGPPLSGSYRISVGAQQYAIQVFACDTLYTPLGTPEAQTKWDDVRRLSAADTPDDLRQALWNETYKPSGAQDQPDSPFQQLAAQDQLGAPLTGQYAITVEHTPVEVQVFAADTLYRTGDEVRRMRELPQPQADVAPRQGIRDTGASIDPHDTSRRPTFAQLPLPTSAHPRVAQFFGYTHWAHGGGRVFYTATYGCHSGIDLGVPVGTPLLALDYGVVYHAGDPRDKNQCPFGGCPPLVILVRYGAVYGVYGHCSEVHVSPGQVVHPGDILGLSGEYPANTPHLHFEVRPVSDPTLANNPVDFFSSELRDGYFAQQLTALGGVSHFCCGSFADQPTIRFGKHPIESRPCEH